MTSSALPPPPEPGPRVPSHIQPEDFYRVAQDFVAGQKQALGIYVDLNDSLNLLTGAAGDDDPAKKFATSYTPAVQNVYNGLMRVYGLLGNTGQGLAMTANNHLTADADSAGQPPGQGFPPLVSGTASAPAEPPQILGQGDTGIRNSLAHFVLPFYPNADVPKMGLVSNAFTKARDALNNLAGDMNSRLSSLTGNNTGEDLDALTAFWQRVTGAKDGTLLSSLPQTCDALSHACDDYISEVERTRFKIHDIVQGLGEQLAATTTIALIGSLIFTPLAGGLIEAAGGAGELAVATVEMGAIFADLVAALGAAPALAAAAEAGGALTVAIKNTPDPNVSEVDAAGLRYEPSPKHGPTQRGNIAPAPKDGQTALEHSAQIKPTSTRRVGVDAKNNEIVIFDETHPGTGVFHGHVRSWDELRTDPVIQNALKRAGLVDSRGRIIS